MAFPRAARHSSYALILLLPASAWGQFTRPEPPVPHGTGRQRLAEAQLAVAVSPDGRRIACSGQNRAVRQWAIDGPELAPLANAPGGWCVAWSPDGRLIAGCGLDRIIRLWDADTGREVRHLQGHTQIAWMAAFLPDGRSLISVGEDATIRLWDVDTGAEKGQLVGHPGPVWCMALSADGRRLATGGADGMMRVWDIAACRVVRILDGQHGGGVGALGFSPDGRTIGSTGWQDHRLLLWEVGTGRIRRQIPHDGGSKFLMFSPDGRSLFTAGNDRAIRQWDMNGCQTMALEGHAGAVNGLALVPGGRTLVSVSNDQTVRTWDVARRESSPSARMLPARQLESCWCALSRPDGRGAYEAAAALTAAPEQALVLIKERVRPAGGPNQERIRVLLIQAGDSRYDLRQQATRELAALGEEAEGQLREALTRDTDLETRRRASRLLAKLDAAGPSTDTLRALRAVEVLERIATPPARDYLRDLAGGTPAARLTVEARESLERLSREAVAKR